MRFFNWIASQLIINWFGVLLFFSIILRSIFDVAGLVKPGRVLDLFYVALFAVVGAISFFHDPSSNFGYLCFFVSLIWLLAFFVRRRKNSSKDSSQIAERSSDELNR